MWQEYLAWGLLIIISLVFAFLFGYKEREIQELEENAEKQRQIAQEQWQQVLAYKKKWKQ
jgi:hypothetical protein